MKFRLAAAAVSLLLSSCGGPKNADATTTASSTSGTSGTSSGSSSTGSSTGESTGQATGSTTGASSETSASTTAASTGSETTGNAFPTCAGVTLPDRDVPSWATYAATQFFERDREQLWTGSNVVVPGNDKCFASGGALNCDPDGYGWFLTMFIHDGQDPIPWNVGVYERPMDLAANFDLWEGDPNDPGCENEQPVGYDPDTMTVEVYEVTEDCIAGRYQFDPPIQIGGQMLSGDYFLAPRCGVF